jgi:hypothetical protein
VGQSTTFIRELDRGGGEAVIGGGEGGKIVTMMGRV